MSMRLTIQCPIRHRTLSPEGSRRNKNRHFPSTGTVGDSYDNALAERTNNSYKRELVWGNKLYRTADELECVTMRWVSWYNSKRLHASLGHSDITGRGERVP